MSERWVIVSGSTRGIGLAITTQLLQAGFSVHMLAKSGDRLESTSKKLNILGKVSYSCVDLADRTQIKNFIANWDKRVWGIVNNAGVWAEERLDDEDFGIWDPIMRLNVDSIYFLTKGMLKWIEDNGRIINMSSQLGMSGREGFGAYSASKHAVIGLTRCWALELGSRGITVNAVCPGWVRTQSNLNEIAEWAANEQTTLEVRLDKISETLTLRRFIEPEEVGNLVSFLIGPSGSGITGQAYEIK